MKTAGWNDQNLQYVSVSSPVKFQKIQQHNSEGHSFNLSMNHFGDLTLDEYRIFIRRGLLFHFSNETGRRGLAFIPPSKKTLPHTVDWRTKGYVTRVKDQGKFVIFTPHPSFYFLYCEPYHVSTISTFHSPVGGGGGGGRTCRTIGLNG